MPNRLYQDDKNVPEKDEYQIEIELNAVRPIIQFQARVDYVVSASLNIASLTGEDPIWRPGDNRPKYELGVIQILVGDYVTWEKPVTTERVSFAKFTGGGGFVPITQTGRVTVAGNGANQIDVNIGSDRPVIGNTLRWDIMDSSEVRLTVGIATFFSDNVGNLNQYWQLL